MDSEPQVDQVEIKREELKSTLAKHHVPTEQWGTGSAKTFDHLLKEVVGGETVLVENEQGELRRKVEVVGIDIFHTDENGKRYKLVEDRQEFKDGRERRRNLKTSLTEKIKPGEDTTLAASRGVGEELGIDGDVDVTFLETQKSETESPSYPGLVGQFVIHNFSADIGGQQYNPDGYKEEQPDKSTFFVWKPVEETTEENKPQ